MDEAEREVFRRLHEGLPKQGPGSDASTRRALAMVGPLPSTPDVLDLGCGPGRQTLVLARETGGQVTAIDQMQPFLDQLSSRAKAEKLDSKITTVRASMDDLPYAHASFDLVWSEGAIYAIGFERGLRLWRPLVRREGALAVTECSWLVDDSPTRIRAFWDAAYPAMQSRAANERIIASLGLRVVDTFVLDASEWWDDYYTPIRARIEALRNERPDAPWQRALDAADEEEEMVREGFGIVGYVFYVMKQTAA